MCARRAAAAWRAERCFWMRQRQTGRSARACSTCTPIRHRRCGRCPRAAVCARRRRLRCSASSTCRRIRRARAAEAHTTAAGVGGASGRRGAAAVGARADRVIEQHNLYKSVNCRISKEGRLSRDRPICVAPNGRVPLSEHAPGTSRSPAAALTSPSTPAETWRVCVARPTCDGPSPSAFNRRPCGRRHRDRQPYRKSSLRGAASGRRPRGARPPPSSTAQMVLAASYRCSNAIPLVVGEAYRQRAPHTAPAIVAVIAQRR